MTTAAKDVLKRVADTLVDPTSVRFTVPELCRYFNDGHLAVLARRPELFATTINHTLVAGARQTIPEDGHSFIEALHATSGLQRAIRQCAKATMDAQWPFWVSAPQSSDFVHFMFEPREPRVFWLYPPAKVGAGVSLTYAKRPTPIAEAGASIDAVAGNVSLPDEMAPALADYILFRCFSKDAEHPANAQRAAAHYAAFNAALGGELAAKQTVQPA